MRIGVIACDPFVVSFRKLLQQKLPVKTSFKLRGIAKLINEELSKFNETKEQLALEHARKDEDGKPIREENGIRIDASLMPAFIKKLRELESIEVNVPPVLMSELGKEKDLTLLPEDYCNLEFLCE